MNAELRHVTLNHDSGHYTPNQEAWTSFSRSRGSAILVSWGMAGELYPNTNPKLMGPRTEANVARYNFLFFTLLWRERGTKRVTEVSVKCQCVKHYQRTVQLLTSHIKTPWLESAFMACTFMPLCVTTIQFLFPNPIFCLCSYCIAWL